MTFALWTRLRHLRLASSLAALALAIVACGEEDTTPPAPPLVEAIRTPTSLDTQTLRGTAEFGATVTITGAGAVSPTLVIADPYTARWEATVTLTEGENALQVTATDAAGNTSAATPITIVREPIHAEGIELRLSRSLITADDAAIEVRVQVTNDEPVDLSGIELEVAVTDYPKSIQPVLVTTDAGGRATAVVSGLDVAGIGRIVVTATAPESEGLSADADFLVDTGRPATVDLLLSDGVQPPADALTVAAGTTVFASIDVLDAPANEIPDAPVMLFTDAPGAFIAGNAISDVPAGTWRVVGAVSGSLLSDVATLTVTPGPPANIAILPPAADVGAGEPITFEVVVTDALGNVIEPAVFTLTTDAPAGTTTFAPPATYTFCALGDFTVTAEAGIGGPTASSLVSVLPGAPSALSLDTSPAPAIIAAGDNLSFTTQTLDICGNPTPDFVEVTTNAPGAIVGAGIVSGLTDAGSWLLVARVPGTALVDSVPIIIDADTTSTIVTLFLTSHGTDVGLPIGYAVTAVDAFGNPVPGTPVITTSDPGAVVDPVAQTIVFDSEGIHTVTATLGTASDSDFVIVTAFDATGPTVAITSPSEGTRVPPGSDVTVVVSASDDVALAEVLLQATGEAESFQAQLAPGGTSGGTFTFTVSIPGGARLGAVELIAQAVDTAGNRTSTPIRTILVDPAAGLTLIAGYTAETLAVGGTLAAPRGVAVAGLSTYVNNAGTDQILQISPSGSVSAFTPMLGSDPLDLAYDVASDRWFASARGPDRIFRVNAAGAATTFVLPPAEPRGMSIAGTNIWTVYDDDRARRYAMGATALPTASTCTLDLSGAGLFPGLGGGGRGLLSDAAGALWITESNNDAIWRVAPGFFCSSTPAATFAAGGGDVNDPRDIIQGPSGMIYWVNRGDGRLMRLDPATCGGTGCAVTVIGSGFDQPWGLAFTPTGSLIVSDEGSNAVYRINGSF